MPILDLPNEGFNLGLEAVQVIQLLDPVRRQGNYSRYTQCFARMLATRLNVQRRETINGSIYRVCRYKGSDDDPFSVIHHCLIAKGEVKGSINA